MFLIQQTYIYLLQQIQRGEKKPPSIQQVCSLYMLSQSPNQLSSVQVEWNWFRSSGFMVSKQDWTRKWTEVNCWFRCSGFMVSKQGSASYQINLLNELYTTLLLLSQFQFHSSYSDCLLWRYILYIRISTNLLDLKQSRTLLVYSLFRPLSALWL